MKIFRNTTKPISHKRVIAVSFLVDISDVGINVIIAVISGSVTMISQALQGAVDLLASGFLYIGNKLSSRRADASHPYGYGREMYFWVFMAGLVMIGVTSTLSFYWGLQRILHPEPIHNLLFAYGALIISFFTNFYAFSLSYRRLIADKPGDGVFRVFFKSPFIATKTTLLLDFAGSLASVFGLIALVMYSLTGDVRFDGVGAMIVGISLAFFSFFILKDVRKLLIGASASPEVKNSIASCIRSFREVQSIVELKVTHIGIEQLLVLAEIHLKNELTTDDIEKLNDAIRENIHKTVPQARYIHIEPETP
jgi:cation diffusion facilitator family transporter